MKKIIWTTDQDHYIEAFRDYTFTPGTREMNITIRFILLCITCILLVAGIVELVDWLNK